jgi:rhodanese-related sulfurtransferase
VNAPGPDGPEITPARARELMLDPQAPALLIDCRTREEHATARIDGAVLIPMNELAAKLDELEDHQERPIVVHCHHGMRSMQVTMFLRSKGFERTYSMAGGIERWSREIDPSVPRY